MHDEHDFQHGRRRHGGPRGRGRRARRGDVRTAILSLLAEEPMHGYQIMQTLEERTGGAWQPSAGSIYPTLQQLEDEGLVQSKTAAGRREYSLTADGEKAVQQHEESHSKPWHADHRDASEWVALRRSGKQLWGGISQVLRVGDEQQVTAAREIVADARKRIYELLAADEAVAERSPTAEQK